MIKSAHSSLFYLIPALFLSSHFSYAQQSSTYVYCAKQDKSWEWLKDGNGNYIHVNGVEKTAKKRSDTTSWGNINEWSVNYFQISEDVDGDKIKELQQLCKAKYGSEFQFAQPAQSRHSAWKPFGVNEDKIATGVFSIDLTTYLTSSGSVTSTNHILGINQSSDFMNMDQLLNEAINSRARYRLNSSIFH